MGAWSRIAPTMCTVQVSGSHARWQELGGFVDGLFGDEEDMDVPEMVSPS
jgi:hypothetical protein